MGLNEKSSSNSSELTLDLFQSIFEKIEPNIKIDLFEEARGSGRGDNYTATLYRIHLKGHYIDNLKEQETEWEKSVICKRLPDNAARREAYKSVQLFRNEVEFYITIMPELVKFQKSKTGEEFKSIPQCYLARNDLLIMEDLRIKGFKMANRQTGLSAQETQSVLKEIAILHSLGLSYKFQYPKQFEKFKNLISEGIFCSINQDWYQNYYEQLTRNAINMVSDFLPENSEYIQRFAEFAGNLDFFSKMIDLVSTESKLSVICHGDCWTNNFLYRFDDDGNVIETSLVDFQLIRYGSAALDVANLIFCCTTKSIRDQHLQSFLNLYMNEFYEHLQLLGPMPDYCDTKNKFTELFLSEFKTYGKFALGLALDIIPISTCSSEDAPDLYSARSDEPIGAPMLNFPPNDLCKQKMSELLIDLVDGGYL